MVVDDSAVVRGLVTRWIDEEPGLEAVARHANGRLAVEDVGRSAPDVIVLDIEMLVMDGLTALPLLLAARPQAKILIVSTLTKRNAEISFKALSLGALDYVPKPESNREIMTSLEFRGEVIRKIKGTRRHDQARPRDRPASELRAEAVLDRGAEDHRRRQLDRGPGGAECDARPAGAHAQAGACRHCPTYAADFHHDLGRTLEPRGGLQKQKRRALVRRFAFR
jgi:chemotaxis response regulator CheB